MAAAQSTRDGAKIAKAIVAAQKELPAIDRDAVNPHFKSRFTTLDHLLARALPVLHKHGLALLQQPTSIDGAPALKTTLLHESGESEESITPLVLGKNDPQGYGAALTYFRRYAAAAILGVSDQGDDDGNSAQPPAAASEGNGRSRPKVRADKPKEAKGNASEPQRRMIFAKAKEAGLDEAGLRQIFAQVADTEHSDRIPKNKVDQVLAAITGELA